MNTKLNKIFKSFEDVKLESQEVELATVKQITASIDSAFKNSELSRTKLQKAKDALIDAVNTSRKSVEMFNKTKEQVVAFEKTAKDLGLVLPAELQQYVRNLDKELGFAGKYYQTAQTAYNTLK